MSHPQPIWISVYPADLAFDSRIRRIARSCGAGVPGSTYVVFGLQGDNLPAVESIGSSAELRRVPMPWSAPGVRLKKAFGLLVWQLRLIRALMRMRRVSGITCHSVSTLPLGVFVRLWKGCALVYDARELETEAIGVPRGAKVMLRVIERIGCLAATSVMTVDHAIAEWYRKKYHLKTVHVVKNVPAPLDRPVDRTLLRRKLSIPPNDIIFLMQGALVEGRCIGSILEVFAAADPTRHVVFLGNGVWESTVRHYAAAHRNIHYHEAVHPDALLEYTSGADVGLCLIENTCLSFYLALPNKLLEYTICGIPSIVSDFPEMARFVDTHACGWKIEPDVSSLAAFIASLSPDEIESKRLKAFETGKSFDWAHEEPSLLDAYQSAGQQGGRPGKGQSV